MSDKLSIKSRFRNYEVNFINDFAETIKQTYIENTFFIIDKKLAELYKDATNGISLKYDILFIEAIEENKTLDYCQTVIGTLIEKNIRKDSMLIGIGGGVIQDITAFVSSILYRGIRWNFYPTTLLAQADSCIGSKTSINFGGYKNLLGGFYPPSQIYIDMGFLETLPADEIKSGLGEILHFYLIDGSRLSEELMDNYDELIADPKKLKDYILESLKIKKNVIEIDEFDKNERNLFNYGHTFGHAIETVSGYGVNHGQAVTMGMDIANYVSLSLGKLDERDFEFMHKILLKNMPVFHLGVDMMEDYFMALSKDKKNIGENLGCILTKGPGAMFKVQHPLDKRLQGVIVDYFKRIL